SFANAMTENVKLTILSTDGKLVYQNVYSSNGVLDKISVQLSHLKQGLYLCRVNSKNVSSVVIFTKK
ncbi:MAG: T9SS type A sorting domain-containing protein, partial [Paludibacter sp.]|nr:T9SS type A sorting domain-containing protein [Paludibacter sp.]